MTYIKATIVHRDLKQLKRERCCRQRHVAQVARERQGKEGEGAMKFDEFEDTMDAICRGLAIVAGAVAIVWIIIPGIWLIIRGV